MRCTFWYPPITVRTKTKIPFHSVLDQNKIAVISGLSDFARFGRAATLSDAQIYRRGRSRITK